MKKLLLIFFCLIFVFFSSCENEDPLWSTSARNNFYVRNKDVDLPVLVKGNTSSKTFILYVHGGPELGGIIESGNRNFWPELERDYAVVYYDQRGIGMSNGSFDDRLLTIEQFVEDLDKIITVVKYKYGSDISLFLMGGSWGGFVGTAYITTDDFQSKVKGWIEIGGGHNMPLIQTGLKAQIQNVATQQVDKGLSKSQWESLRTYAAEYDLADQSFENWLDILQKYESVTDLLKKDGELEFKPDDFKIPKEVNLLTVLWNDGFNKVGVKMLKRYYKTSLSNGLSKVTIPALLLWGQYDFASPPVLGYDALENLGTPEKDKKLMIIERADHTILNTKPEELLIAIEDFVELYK